MQGLYQNLLFIEKKNITGVFENKKMLQNPLPLKK